MNSQVINKSDNLFKKSNYSIVSMNKDIVEQYKQSLQPQQQKKQSNKDFVGMNNKNQFVLEQ